MMNDKINILFITSEFYQAGTERFVYEVDRAIDKNKFEISILSLLPLNNSEKWNDHYYEKHCKLGTRVYFLNEIKATTTSTIQQRIKRKLTGGSIPDPKTNIRNFIEKFDAISFWGEYCYPELDPILTSEQKKKCLIHIMNSKYQNNNIYNRFNKEFPYHFVSGFGKKEIQFELTEFKNYFHTFLPLSINIDKSLFRWEFSNTPKKRIGIFTRLTSHKPLDPFIYGFHLLLNDFPDAELHIYGTGDPVAEGIYNYVKNLKLEDNVIFRGHQDDIVKTAIDDRLNLVWFHGYHGIPGGFAGFDICTSGIPQIFWDFGNVKNESDQDVFPMFCKLTDFVNKNKQILSNKTEAETLSKKQFAYITKNHDINKHIKDLETIYSEIANGSAL